VLPCNLVWTRREALVASLTTLSSAALVAPLCESAALAQEASATKTQGSFVQELRRLEGLATQLGIRPAETQPRLAEEPEPDAFRNMKERALQLLEDFGRAAGAQAAAALQDTAEFLRRINAAERSAPSPETRAAELAEALARKLTPPPFDDVLRAEYRKDFATAAIRPKYERAVQRDVARVLRNKARYEAVQSKTDVPWYVLAAIHNLEASLNFEAHLHNGDDIRYPTIHVPKGRPKDWDPPKSSKDWELSAQDALAEDRLANQTDWSLERTLYRLEAYNGWGPRLLRNSKTAYLWSFSTNYERGKYAADGKWDPNLVSDQCGAAVLIKALVQGGHIAEPPSWQP
jgi:lysozyme family protein